MTESPRSFPWWVVVGALILTAGYLPTLAAPFDFIDDGNLVYPAPAGTSFTMHVERWWDKVAANVEHLGPFRPTLWVHWEIFANVLNADPIAWRAMRLLWCGLAAAALLWLLRELKLHPTAALIAAAAAMWNPYRNEIWTSLTLSEGVAMPYALAALAAARQASSSERPWRWDLLSMACLLMVLGCKNTFVALVPAQLALRLLPDGMSLREGWRHGRWAAAMYLLPLLLPAAHFVYFKMHWHAGQYETPGPSLEQFGRFLSWMKGAAGLDFLGAGLVLALIAVGIAWQESPRMAIRGLCGTHRAAIVAGTLLLLAGTAVYLPLPMVAARYTMPAIWGLDILFAVLLAGFLTIPLAWPKRIAWAGVAVGLASIAIANVGRQERVAARANLLWTALHEIERTAPPNSCVAWISGESSRGELNVEEGIHFAWHLKHRGRGDVQVALRDDANQPIARVELDPPTQEPRFRLAAGPAATTTPGWEALQTLEVRYRLGTKRYVCQLDTRSQRAAVVMIDPFTAAVMRAAFNNPTADTATLVNRVSGNR